MTPKIPFKKSRKEKDGEEAAASGEKQPLLGGLLPQLPQLPLRAMQGGAMTPSKEHRIGPDDSVRVWDVNMPPSKADMVHGKLTPTFSGVVVGKLRQRKSRITIEIHAEKEEGRSTQADEADGGGTDGAVEGLLRGKSAKHDDNEALRDDQFVTMRIFRPARGNKLFGLFGGDGDDDKGKDVSDDDEHSVSSVSLSGVDKEFHDGKWTEAYIYGWHDLEVIKCHRRTVEMKLGLGEDLKHRELIFPNAQEASTFCSVLESLGKLDVGRAQRRLEAYQANPNNKIRDIGSKVQLLVEIVSAVRLPVAHLATGTDAFAIVNLGKAEVHRTDYQSNTLNPIWTLSSGSLFLLETTPDTFFRSRDGLAFNIYDYDVLGEHELLGRANVMQEELLDGTGERVEYPLILNSKYRKTRGARLVLRFRLATFNDTAFMKAYAAQKKRATVGAYAEEAFVPIHVERSGLLQREKEAFKRITTTGKQEFRVKPGPDPDRPKETAWMTGAQIDAEAQKPSTNWIQTGSGPLGKLYFELIGCDGLPNMSITPLYKTDAYASIIYEDNIVNTDVIMNKLSPRWLPWTQRAFVFNIMHPTSQMMLAVLDFDAGSSVNAPLKLVGVTLDPDDPIGRLTLDFSNMRAGTDYTMQFELTTSSLVSKRTFNGTVTVRVRIEWENERNTLIRSLIPPPEFFINVSEHRDWLASHYAIIGECDTKQFSMDTLASYVEELQEYQALVPVIKSAVFTVLLWRGHLPVTFFVPSIPPRPSNPDQPSESLARRLFKSVTLKLPVHSMIFFVVGIRLVEDYDLLPSLFFFAVAWILLATQEFQNNHPSPWRKKRTYLEHLQVLLFNTESTHTIEPDERKDEIEKFTAEQSQEVEKRKKEAANEARVEQNLKEAEDEEAEVVIETEKKKRLGLSLNVLEPILAPVQQHLEVVVVALRIVSSFVNGEESRARFWIVKACIVIGLLLVGIPWGFLIRWVLRVVVWTFLGPWMKLVDIFYVEGRSREELRKDEKERLRLRYQQIFEARRGRQMQREDALKLMSMKRYMYGSYIVSVPRFKQDRFQEWPLYPSHASPHVEASPPKIKASFRGQHLEVDMIPERKVIKQISDDETSKSADAKGYGSTKHKV